MEPSQLVTNKRIDELEQKMTNFFEKLLKYKDKSQTNTRQKASVVQDIFNISYGKLKQFRLEGKISSRKFGKEYYYDVQEISQKLESGELALD